MSERFTLANRNHLSLFLGVLAGMGAMCPDCGHGTRRTSRRWAACKNPECGRTKIPRRKAEDVVRVEVQP